MRGGPVVEMAETVGSGPGFEIRPARAADGKRLQDIRARAFAPVFASFRSILGTDIAVVAQARAEDEQEAYLATLLDEDSPWEVYVVETSGGVVGFVSLRLDTSPGVGEIGLNAVHPDHSARGIGTAMYRFALSRLRDAGMEVATVGTGGDPSHAPARRAYEKAGFHVGIPSIWLYQYLGRPPLGS